MDGYVDTSIFSKRLREMREKQHKSSVVVSELCGLSSDLYRKYELGENLPTYKSLVLIADYFNCPIDYLTGRSNQRFRIDE